VIRRFSGLVKSAKCMAFSGAMLGFFKDRRRAAVRAQPVPPAWEEFLHDNVPYFRTLGPEARAELLDHVKVLLDEKRFEGCGGLELTDEIKVTIAAQAAVLLLGRETDYYPDLEVILVYPSTYVDRRPRMVEGGIVVEDGEMRLGESSDRGVVVLAWDSVLKGAADVRDGHNVVFHEFAHQLDQEDGEADGAPVLDKRASYAAWARVLGAEYKELLHSPDPVIDDYGMKSPAEFFAVVTEAFFERPRALRARHPALYEQMSAFYKQDPARATTKAR
jgi:hypothetical protein